MYFGDSLNPPGDADRGVKKLKKSEGGRGEDAQHTKIRSPQRLHGVSVEGCRANQSLGWVKARGREVHVGGGGGGRV